MLLPSSAGSAARPPCSRGDLTSAIAWGSTCRQDEHQPSKCQLLARHCSEFIARGARRPLLLLPPLRPLPRCCRHQSTSTSTSGRMAHLVTYGGRRGGLLPQRCGGKAQGEGSDQQVALVHQAGRLLQGCRRAGRRGDRETDAAMGALAGAATAAVRVHLSGISSSWK
jgi:hypothetical protein